MIGGVGNPLAASTFTTYNLPFNPTQGLTASDSISNIALLTTSSKSRESASKAKLKPTTKAACAQPPLQSTSDPRKHLMCTQIAKKKKKGKNWNE